ncbi:MAG: signal peptide peptidase SppA [Planctomycetota bacterium]
MLGTRYPGLLACLLASLTITLPALADEDDTHGPGSGHRIRVIELRGAYSDHPVDAGFDPTSLLLGGPQQQRSFYRLCNKIDEIAATEDFDGIFLDLSSPFSMNLAQVSELRRHIDGLQDVGIDAYAWLEGGSTLSYAIAASCDTILMADFSMLDLPSLAMSTLHFKDAMDLFGVRASVARAGDFKGAVEPYTRSRISEPLANHYKMMLTTMNDHLVEGIASGRLLDPSDIRDAQAERMLTATAAKEAGLVDHLTPFGSERRAVEELLDKKVHWTEPRKAKRKQTNFFEMMSQIFAGPGQQKTKKPTVAVLHLAGAIVDGEKPAGGSVVSGPTVTEIEHLRKDDNIKGVVLRVNSPGGSATASEAIRNALERLVKDKPVVVSMGNMAASGGYWVSCLGRPIFAEPTTITGSIGVFSMKLNFGTLLDRVGIKVNNICLDESASAMGIDRAWTDREIAKIEEGIAETYTRFLRLVASSRQLPLDRVTPLAGGRVWSGSQAWAFGLVDRLGGLDTALAAVAEEAKLEKGYPVLHYPRKRPLGDMLGILGGGDDDVVSTPLGGVALRLLQEAGFDLRPYVDLLQRSLRDPRPRMWLLSPEQINVR